MPFRQNVSYIVTSEYGQRNGTMHYGIDIEAPMKTSILAVADGVVVDAGRHDSMGNYVIIQHKYNDTNYYTFYMHMSEISIKKFQNVSKSEKIGVIGSTGNSTGIHLHLEISTKATADTSSSINPRNFINF